MELIPIIKTVLLAITAISVIALILSYIGYKIKNGTSKKAEYETPPPQIIVRQNNNPIIPMATTIHSQPAVLHHSRLAPPPVAVQKPSVKKVATKKTESKKIDVPENKERYQVVNDQLGVNGKGKKGDYVFKNPYTNQNFNQ